MKDAKFCKYIPEMNACTWDAKCKMCFGDKKNKGNTVEINEESRPGKKARVQIADPDDESVKS